jgi:hypothetical protein
MMLQIAVSGLTCDYRENITFVLDKRSVAKERILINLLATTGNH